jgi:hypothetical protein
VNSQVTLKEGEVKTILSDKGDTLIVMGINDGKSILSDVLRCEILDSMVTEYENKDKANTTIITTLKEIETKQGQQIEILEKQVLNCEKIISNKDEEISLSSQIINEQRKEIRKQRLLKIAGFSGSIILPVITALLMIK